jgi:hypothetical protein
MIDDIITVYKFYMYLFQPENPIYVIKVLCRLEI